MIGPVSNTGRAMMASLQQAMAKGMPPDQAVQYVKSMAMQGVAPLADLYSMMNQFQRLKQQQVQPPQTPPTIKDQLNMMDQMQQMQGGIAGMQAPPPAGQPMDRGLGAIDAGRMEYPQFAGGGVVALASGGRLEGIDFSEMTDEQLAMLEQGEDIEVARAAFKERLDRSGYTSPKELFGKYIEAVKAGLPTGPAIKFDMSGGAPAYMRDEQGRIRTPGMGGPVTYSFTEGIVPMERPAVPAVTPTESAVPTDAAVTPYSSPQAAGAAFDLAAAKSREGVRQESVPAQPRSDTAMATTGGGKVGVRDRYAELREGVEGRKFEEVADSFSPEEAKRINKALSGLTAEKKDAVRMALAQAGFRMAAAASRTGRQRTTGLGALAEGAIGGMQQYAAAQKELRQTEKELNKEMADLRKYQDQVARGERTAKRDFEERKQRDILDLETKSEQLRQFNVELGQRMKIAQMQYAGEGSVGTARNRTLDVNILNYRLQRAQDEVENVRLVSPSGAKQGSETHLKEIRAAEQRVENIDKQLSGMLSGAGGVPLTGGTGPYSNMSPEEFKATLRKELGI